jgi:hypothetical protein
MSNDEARRNDPPSVAAATYDVAGEIRMSKNKVALIEASFVIRHSCFVISRQQLSIVPDGPRGCAARLASPHGMQLSYARSIYGAFV